MPRWTRSSRFSHLAIVRHSFAFTASAATCCTCTVSRSIWERIVPFWVCAGPPKLASPTAFGDMAARYVAAMLAHQPTGPFYLGGHSFGAMVAYEMALQLVEQGHEIGLLAIIDQRRPGWRLTARDALPVLPRIIANIPSLIRDDLAPVPKRRPNSTHASNIAKVVESGAWYSSGCR